MSAAQKKLVAEAVANVKKWMEGRQLEELTAIISPDGRPGSNPDAYCLLARIAGGTPERNAHLPAAWFQIRDLFIERIREIRYLPIRANEMITKKSSKLSRIKSKNAQGKRGPQKDGKDLRNDAVKYALKLRKSGLSKKRSCELAKKNFNLECTWETVRNDMDKPGQ